MKNFYKARAILLTFYNGLLFSAFSVAAYMPSHLLFCSKNTTAMQRASSNYYYLHLSYYSKKVEKYIQYTLYVVH